MPKQVAVLFSAFAQLFRMSGEGCCHAAVLHQLSVLSYASVVCQNDWKTLVRICAAPITWYDMSARERVPALRMSLSACLLSDG